MINGHITKKLFVFTKKSVYMQRIADYVRTGHQAYINGLTDTEKIFTTYDKLVFNNPVFDNKLKAFRAREKGFATGRLLLFQNKKKPEKIHWILLIHGTVDQLSKGEKWRHAEDKHARIQLLGYELLRVQKEGAKKPVWTWRYTTDRYQDLRDSMVSAIRSRRDQDFKILIDLLFGTMGFGGSREQAKSLVLLAKEEWKKRRGDEDMPAIPKLLGWVRRKGDIDNGHFLNRPKLQPPAKKEIQIDLEQFMTDSELSNFVQLINLDQIQNDQAN
jgi:hypothetical protein